MVKFLIILVLSIALVAVLGSWRRDRRLLFELRKGSQDGDAEGTSALEKANEDLKASQADLQRRWQYLAEAQRLSHSGTFGWKVQSGELVWSDETYKILVSHEKPILRLIWYSTEFTLRIGTACNSSGIVSLRTAWTWMLNTEFSCLT